MEDFLRFVYIPVAFKQNVVYLYARGLSLLKQIYEGLIDATGFPWLRAGVQDHLTYPVVLEGS